MPWVDEEYHPPTGPVSTQFRIDDAKPTRCGLGMEFFLVSMCESRWVEVYPGDGVRHWRFEKGDRETEYRCSVSLVYPNGVAKVKLIGECGEIVMAGVGESFVFHDEGRIDFDFKREEG